MSVEELRELVSGNNSYTRTTFDPRDENARFFIDDDGKMKFVIGSNDARSLTQDAYVKLGQMVGIPGAYTEKTPNIMMVPHMNYWLVNRGSAQITACSKEGTVELFSKGSVIPVRDDLIVDVVEEVFGKDLRVAHVSQDACRSSYSIVSAETTEPVRVGDMVQSGVSILNSYSRQFPTTIAAYIHVLSCTNGAVSTDNVFKMSMHGGSEEEYIDWLKVAVQDAKDSIEEEVQRLQNMANTSISSHLSDNLESFFIEFGVPMSIREEIRSKVIDGRVTSLYDLYSIVTDVASNSEDVLENPVLSHRLMQVGGSMSAHPQFCEMCHRALLN